MGRLMIDPAVARRVVEGRWPGDDFASRHTGEELARRVASELELKAAGVTHDERTVELYWQEAA